MLQLVIPAFNEQERLPQTLRRLREHVLRQSRVPGLVEVIVVDNASTDATAEVALAVHSPAMPVRVVRCEVRGKGAAVRAGVAATQAEYVAFMDADCATDLDALDEAWRLLSTGADVAVASRALPESVTTQRHCRLRSVGATAYRGVAGLIVPGIRDTQCGFKAMRGDLARSVFAEMRTAGFSFDVELLARMRSRGAAIREFAVSWVDVPGSTFVPARHGVAAFVELARIALLVQGGRRGASVLDLPPRPVLQDLVVEA